MLSCSPVAAALVTTELLARLACIAAAVAGRRRRNPAIVECTDPPFTAGHWIPDLVRAAGRVAAEPGARTVPTTWAAIAAAAPEHVVVAPYGYHLQGAFQQAQAAVRAFPGLHGP